MNFVFVELIALHSSNGFELIRITGNATNAGSRFGGVSGKTSDS